MTNLTPFMQDLNRLLEEHGYDPKTIRTLTVDGPRREIMVTRYLQKSTTVDGYSKVIDPVSKSPVLVATTYPMFTPVLPFDRNNMTAEQVMAQPVGSVIAGSDDAEFTRRADGRFTDVELDPTDVIADMDQYVGSYGPVRLLKRGGE